MRTALLRTIAFGIAVLCAAAAWGQTTAAESRVLSFPLAETPQQVEDIAQLIASLTRNPQLIAAVGPRTLSVSGTDKQVELAQWLAKEIDKPGGAQPPQQSAPAAPEYLAGEDDVVRMLHVNNARTVPDFQELVSTVRAITDMRLTFSLNSQMAIAVRGPREMVRLCEWLVNEIDQPATPVNTTANPANAVSPNPPAPEYRMSGVVPKSGPLENVVRVFYLTRTPSVQELQEGVSLMRAITECRRTFSISARKALVVRGTPEQLGLAEFLYNEMQAARELSPDAARAKHEYRIVTGPAFPRVDLVRVFRITSRGTVQESLDFAATVRNKTEMRYVVTFHGLGLLVVRGSDSQIALAEQMVEDRRRLNAQ